MAVRVIRTALHTLVLVLGGVLLILGGATRFSPDGMTPDTAAFIRVMAPLLIGSILTAALFEIGLEGAGQAGRIRAR